MTLPRIVQQSVIVLLSLFVHASGQTAEAAKGTPSPAAQEFPLTAFAALGSSFVQTSRLNELDWKEVQIAAFLDGMRAAFQGKSIALDESARHLTTVMGQQLAEFEKRKQQQTATMLAQPGRLAQYMKEMRKRFSLQISDSGLGFNIQTGQLGVRPRPGDTVVVSCEARAADGMTRLPQLSNDHVRVKLAALLPGFMEGLQMMTIDSTAIFLVPPELSFGSGEWPEGVERGQPLFFMVTLHDVIGAEAAP